MNISVASLLEAARRGLLTAVQPELQGEHARAQLAGVIDILAKLERMADWAPVILREEREALERGIAAVEARAAAAGLALPPDAAEDRQQRLRQLSDWVFDDDVPAGALRDEFDALLRAALRDAVAAERRHVPRTDFSAMTGSKEG